MSVTSVTTALPTPYGSVSGNNSRGVKYAARVDQFQEDAAAQADGSPVTGARGTGTADAGEVGSAGASRFQSAFAEALRADGASAARSSGKASGEASGSGSASSQSPAGIALYKRVSLIGNNESSPSALLKSWNSIVQGGTDDGDTAAATLQAFLQNGASGYGSGILDVTA